MNPTTGRSLGSALSMGHSSSGSTAGIRGGSSSAGGNTPEDRNGRDNMMRLLEETEGKLRVVKQLDEAVLGEDGIMVKLAEAEARMAQAIKSRCRVEARLEKMQESQDALHVQELVDDVNKEVEKHRGRSATNDDMKRDEALKKMEKMEDTIKEKLSDLKPRVEMMWDYMQKDKTRSLQTLGSSVTEQQRRLQKLRYTINELRRRLETDAVPTAEAR